MASAQAWLDTVSHNLANISTTGYKRDVMVFNEGLQRELNANEGTGRAVGTMGAGTIPQAEYTIFEVGHQVPTGNPLDLAISTSSGMFAVQTAAGTRYTRDGAFRLDQDRNLVTLDGNKVLDGQNNAISVPAGKFEVGRDGSLMVNERPIGTLGLVGGTFTKVGGNLFTSSNATAIPATEAQVSQGFLESSNVNAIEEMIAMIRLNRAFEMAQRSATSQDESTQQLVNSLSNR